MDLASFRKTRGLSQDECAVEIGIGSKSYVSGLETGALKAPLRLALRIERWSGGRVPAESLVEDEDRDLLKTHRELSAAAAADQAAGARA